MFKGFAGAVLIAAAAVGTTSAQTAAQTTLKDATHEITVKVADAVYTGTVALKMNGEKVSGDMLITVPTEIKGKMAGTAKGGVLALDFPYEMTENQCKGSVKMNITMPATPGVATGTMEARGCAEDPAQVLPGTVELKPIAAKTPR